MHKTNTFTHIMQPNMHKINNPHIMQPNMHKINTIQVNAIMTRHF